MDSLIAASARALAAGDALGALKRVALRDDPPALALRGIAMAQLGELARARAAAVISESMATAYTQPCARAVRGRVGDTRPLHTPGRRGGPPRPRHKDPH